MVAEDTKNLVEALISNQVKAEMATDLISGKGNGLIMLLHGYVLSLTDDLASRSQFWH